MKILVVCQHYWPESFQVTAVCESLAARGHDVTALVGLPNYPEGIVPEGYRHGRNRIQEKDGVRIIRSFEVGRGSSPFRLAVNYYSYSLFATHIAKGLSDDFDVVLAYQLSPVMMAEPAVRYKELHGVPLLIYCCDLWPESMKVLLGSKFPFLLDYYTLVSKRIYESADCIAAQSPAFAEYFESVLGVDRSKIVYVPHFATDTHVGDGLICDHEGTNFMLMGNMGRAQDLPIVLEAVASMETSSGFKVHFVGDGACLEETKRSSASLGLDDRVVFHGRRPFSEMEGYYRIADACVLALNGDSWIGTTLPSRLQGYMAAGKPVLAAVNGGARKVIEDSCCGGAVPAGDAYGLAMLMDDFVQNPNHYSNCGASGRAYFDKHFTRKKHMDTVEGLLRALVERKG